jgi:hypothetical protein
MRLIPLVPAVFVLVISGPAFAQEWTEYPCSVLPGKEELRRRTWSVG